MEKVLVLIPGIRFLAIAHGRILTVFRLCLKRILAAYIFWSETSIFE